jgi:hypothetical protein
MRLTHLFPFCFPLNLRSIKDKSGSCGERVSSVLHMRVKGVVKKKSPLAVCS